MQNHKVSIVLPCYNGADFLSQSIDSVLAQTYRDWELILVNDCSKDNSLEIMRQYAEKDERIIVVDNEVNKKLPATLNVGFARASGQYLTWTSHDNKMGKSMLEEFVAYLDEHADVGLVTANYAAFDNTGKILYEVSMEDPEGRLPHHNTICYAFMYRREVMETIGGYDENLFLIEDYDYWIRIWQKFKIGKIDKVLYYTCVNEVTLTASRKKEIARRLLWVRMHYFDSFDKALKSNPVLRRDYFISIVKEMVFWRRLPYVLKFSVKSPIKFGCYYLFVYRPKQILKSWGVYSKLKSFLKRK